MPQRLGEAYKLRKATFSLFMKKYGRVRCRNPSCPNPVINVGDEVVTRSNKNNGVNVLRIYHKKCAQELNIIV